MKFFKIDSKFNQDYAFLIFVSFLAGILSFFSGVSAMSALLTGIFVYIFLRFCYFLWNIILKFVSRSKKEKPDV